MDALPSWTTEALNVKSLQEALWFLDDHVWPYACFVSHGCTASVLSAPIEIPVICCDVMQEWVSAYESEIRLWPGLCRISLSEILEQQHFNWTLFFCCCTGMFLFFYSCKWFDFVYMCVRWSAKQRGHMKLLSKGVRWCDLICHQTMGSTCKKVIYFTWLMLTLVLMLT